MLENVAIWQVVVMVIGAVWVLVGAILTTISTSQGIWRDILFVFTWPYNLIFGDGSDD